MGSREISALTVLAECPFMDIDTFGAVMNPRGGSSYSRVLISRMKKLELIESLDGISAGVLHRKLVRISANGRALIDRHYGLKKNIQLSQLNEIPEAKIFHPHRLPVFKGAFEKPGRTHFNRTDLTRLWMQLRVTKASKMCVLWDFVRHPESVPLIGNPDLVLFNGLDLEKGHFQQLVVVEWEFGEKPNHVIYDRIEELTRNPELLFLFVFSPHMSILKNWATVMRKHIPGSSYYSHKNAGHQFHSRFLNEGHHLTKIFFVPWVPSDAEVFGSKIEEARCLRFDHEEFDLLSTNLRVTPEGMKVRDKIPFNRFQGKKEVKLGDLMRFMNG